jgi:hypothetical protein
MEEPGSCKKKTKRIKKSFAKTKRNLKKNNSLYANNSNTIINTVDQDLEEENIKGGGSGPGFFDTFFSWFHL